MMKEMQSGPVTVCLGCHSQHSQSGGACPTCGGMLAPSQLANAVIRRVSQQSKEAQRARSARSLRAWEKVRTRNLQLAVVAALTLAPLVWVLTAQLNAFAAASIVAVLGCTLVVRLYRFTREQYETLPYARDDGGHRCIFCGHRGVYLAHSLLGHHVHCAWCRARLHCD